MLAKLPKLHFLNLIHSKVSNLKLRDQSNIKELYLEGYQELLSDVDTLPVKVYSRKRVKKASANQLEFNLIFGNKLNPLEQPVCSCFSVTINSTSIIGSIAGKTKMVQTRNNTNDGNPQPETIAVQLAAIAAKLESIDSLKADIAAQREEIAALKGKERSQESRYDEGDSSWRGRPPYRPYNKIDFPVFGGGDPRGWVLKAEKYFKYYQIPEDDKVEVASMHLEGDALDLYSWLSSDQPISFWEELVQILTKNFGPAEFQNPDEHLCSIKQTGSVQEYRQEFTKRSSRVTGWPDHCLLGVFLNGLKDDLKSDVRIHKPRTVYKAMSLALEFESKLSFTRPTRNTSWTSGSKTLQPDSRTSSAQQLSQPKTNVKLSDTEKQTRFLKGECFRCGDKYRPGHRCKTGTLKILEAEEETDESPPAAQQPDFVSDPEETAEISLHAILGKPHPTTMKVQGKINSTEVLILIDGGSTHNFISEILVRELHIPTQPVAPFGVQIGNGDVIRCNNICKGLSLRINDLGITQDFHPFSLGGADLVLGIQWELNQDLNDLPLSNIWPLNLIPYHLYRLPYTRS
ncbi:hypothetical protein E3N88_09364 [Mikania micrantha]|uniref:Retrotransposon gag domain-containing protein n=1 Tax=Mikania micrantha TaxID=192012 RepID=A0A5N6PJR4_9ASTR|nr:hypothetical protein E3N88_09364 [Mikania micrantha]